MGKNRPVGSERRLHARSQRSRLERPAGAQGHACRHGRKGGRRSFVQPRKHTAAELTALAAQRQRRAHLVERDRSGAGCEKLEIVGQAGLERDLRCARQHSGRDAIERGWTCAGSAVAERSDRLAPTRATLRLIGQTGQGGEGFDGIGTSAHWGNLGLYEQRANATRQMRATPRDAVRRSATLEGDVGLATGLRLLVIG